MIDVNLNSEPYFGGAYEPFLVDAYIVHIGCIDVVFWWYTTTFSYRCIQVLFGKAHCFQTTKDVYSKFE